MRHMAMVALGGIVLAQAGCGRVLFQDDFDADVVGMAPNDTPPGPPDGDLIYWADPTNASLRVVAGSEPADHDLRYRKHPETPSHRFVGFMSREIAPSQRAFTTTWTGVAELDEADGPLDVWIGNTHLGAIAAIRLEDGRVLQRTDVNEYLDIGELPNGNRHTVIITVDREAETYSLSISGPGMETISTPGVPVLDTGYLTTSRPTLYLWFGEGGTGPSTYTVDEVRIVETDP